VTKRSWSDLATVFGLGPVTGSPAYVARGAGGEIWRLETGTGVWAVKWLFDGAPSEPRPADVDVQFAAAAAGIPLPLPVLTPAEDAVAIIGQQYARVHYWADLAQPAEPPVDDSTAAQAGRLLGVLHGLALASPEPDDPWYTEVPSAHDWTILTGQAQTAGMAWAAQLKVSLDRIATLSARTTGPRPPGPSIVCHRDFNPDNVIPAASGDGLVVLDWENAGPLPPSLELGYALFAWTAGHEHPSPSAITAMLGGYRAASGRDTDVSPGLFITAIAAHLNFLHSMASLAIIDPAQRDYATRQVTELLDDGLDDLARFLEATDSQRNSEAASP
jgi:Ser/Thr protein kinase RdoA (MazF antagonist)